MRYDLEGTSAGFDIRLLFKSGEELRECQELQGRCVLYGAGFVVG